MKQGILAVVVTHNRCELLTRCLDFLLRQTRPPEEIVVINNGSTDKTVEMLVQRGIRCVTQENVGSAGGWHRGIEIAMEEGFDAVWLMDDDGYPDEKALERLSSRLTPGVACVSSTVLCEDDKSRLVFPLPLLSSSGIPVLFSTRRKIFTLDQVQKEAGDDLYPFAHFFNGALISVAAVRAAGNVERDFFIFGDELDYLYRLRRVGKVFTVLSAHHYHPDVTQRPLNDMKVYYYIKNTFILNRRYLDLVLIRNFLTVAAALFRVGRRNGWTESFHYLLGRNRRVLWQAVVRGLRGRIAKDFNG